MATARAPSQGKPRSLRHGDTRVKFPPARRESARAHGSQRSLSFSPNTRDGETDSEGNALYRYWRAHVCVSSVIKDFQNHVSGQFVKAAHLQRSSGTPPQWLYKPETEKSSIPSVSHWLVLISSCKKIGQKVESKCSPPHPTPSTLRS